MKNDIQLLFKNLIDKYKRTKRWKKIVGLLSCITIFITTYFLMSPAITETATTYTFHLIDSFSGENYTWKTKLGATTSYDLKLHYVDTQGNYIEGSDLTLELKNGTDFGNVAYGLGYVPMKDSEVRGLDLIDKFNLKTKTTSNGNKYVFDHAEVLVGTEWKSFYSDMETSEHWALYCYNASHDNETAKNYTLANYGWIGTYEEPTTSGTTTTYKATRYDINAETEYKIVYKLVMNGNDTVVPTVSADSGITFKLFNYEGDNTEKGVNANGLYNYFAFRGIGTAAKKINADLDADGFTSKRAKVKTRLDSNDNPVFNCQGKCDNDSTVKNTSLGYLFGATTNAKETSTVGVTSYSPINTPLIKAIDNNGVEYYYYDSNSNAVDYDIQNKRFLLRNYSERSYDMTTYAKSSERFEFLPFNYWTNTTLNGANSMTYQHEAADIDHWYGMTMEFEFYMPKDGLIKGNPMKFEFSGDDDVWVFIDDVLVLDLGGTHGSVDGSINFNSGRIEAGLNWNGTVGAKNVTSIYKAYEAADALNEVNWNSSKTTYKNYEKHTLKFFYLERGGSVANCKIKFNIPVLQPGTLSVLKDFVGEDKYNENHEFTLYNVESNTPVTVPNTKYTVSGVEYFTDAEGKFTLKNNEVAIFKLTNFKNYYVEETKPGSHAVSHACTLDGVACPSINKTDTVTINPDSTYQAIFTNKPKPYNLNVSKIAYDISESEDNLNTDDFSFEVILKNDKGSPVDINDDINSKYIVNHETGVVTFTLKSKSDITIYDIPIDTIVTLREVAHDGYQTIMKKTEDDYLLSNGDTYEFIMDSNKAITVYNIPGVELPDTGGNGILKHLFIGISLILISIKLGKIYFLKLKEGGE